MEGAASPPVPGSDRLPSSTYVNVSGSIHNQVILVLLSSLVSVELEAIDHLPHYSKRYVTGSLVSFLFSETQCLSLRTTIKNQNHKISGHSVYGVWFSLGLGFR
jgi:hypothetical protein